jgi:hypothetical protein
MEATLEALAERVEVLTEVIRQLAAIVQEKQQKKRPLDFDSIPGHVAHSE